MSEQNQSQTECALHELVKTIVQETDSLYELDYLSGTYRVIKSSRLFQSTFGTKGFEF